MAKEKQTSRGRRIGKHICRALAGIVAAVLIVLIGARGYFRIPVASYYRNSEKTFVIPGLSEGMIVQGLDYDSAWDSFLISAYRTDGGASQLSVVSRADGEEVKRLRLADAQGRDFTGHVGGVALAGDYIYVADEQGLMVYDRRAVEEAASGDKVSALGVFATRSEEDALEAAFVYTHEGLLYVGEFYREENYPTPESHHLETASGEENPAVILTYRLDAESPFGISPAPERVYSIPGLVQGMCMDADGRILLSTSYGPAFSHLSIYETPEQQGELTVLGYSLPCYILDEDCLVQQIKLPPMAEEIVCVDGKVYTMCEAATDKYIFGKFTSARYCYATELSAYDG